MQYKAVFELFQKLLVNICKSIHDIINYSIFIFPFEPRKCGKEDKKLQKSEYLKNENSFLNEIECIFIVFEGLSSGKKIKNSRHKL